MKTLLLFCLLLAVEAFAANPTFQSFDTNNFVANATANTVRANTNALVPNALVTQAQLSGATGATNGITASTATNIVNALAILQQSGTGTNTSIGSLTIIQGAYTNRYYANGSILRSNNIAPFEWYFWNTNGTYTSGTGATTRVAFDIQGNLSLPQGGGGGTVLMQTANISQGLNAGGGGLTVNSSGNDIRMVFLGSESGKSNIIVLDSTGRIRTNDLATFIASLGSGTGTLLPANTLGVLTNNGSGFTNWSTAIPGTWIGAGTLPKSAADTSWMPLTNAVAFSNATGVPTPGKALVIAPGKTNSFGAVLLNETNWPSGGGSAFPLAADADANQFSITNLWTSQWRTNASGTQLTFNLRPDFSQSLPAMTLTPAADATYAGFKANFFIAEGNGFGGNYGALLMSTNNGVATTIQSNLITTGTGIFNSGTVSIIPTNAALVVTVETASGTSLPIGITNATAGRGTPTVQYFLIDAVTGVAKITFSNEMTGKKLFRSPGSLALIDTNFYTLPITSTNAVWRVRDESSGTGTSVGVITNWIDL